MLKSTLRRGALSVGLAVLGFFLSVSAPSDSFARQRRSGKVVRKASHSVRHGRRAKSHSVKFHRVSRPIIGSEKQAIIEQLRSITDTEVSDSLIDSSNVASNAMYSPIDLSLVVNAPLMQKDATAIVLDSDFFREHNFSLLDNADTINVTKSDIVNNIIAWFGTRYVFGGETANGIDCSAFTRDVFRKSFGVDLPRTAAMQSVLGQKIERTGLQFGDMVFFKTDRYAPVTHVGIYMGEGLFANAQSSRGVTLASLNDPYWAAKFLFGKRMYGNMSTARTEVNKELDLAVESGSLPATYHEFD
jgi:lipoprotein Spr